ncbi:MAG: capsule assembly Wzi family protein [Salegentibacter sp.]
MKFILTAACIIFTAMGMSAQLLKPSADLNLVGLGYAQEEAPFWLYSNRRGRLNGAANLAAWGNISTRYYLYDDVFLEGGVGILYQDGYSNKVQFDESYLSFQNDWLSVTLGRKQKKELYKGLSASNENILWSLNARPLPGIRFSTSRTIFFGKERRGLGFDASLEEYVTDDDRYVNETRIHHKSFHLVYKASDKFEIKAGLQHFVEWAGISPDYGRLPSSFQDYLSVFAGREGSDSVNGEEANSLGNHLGSYEIYFNTEIAKYKVQLIYNHLFEDGSGRVLRNTPDGRYGIYIEDIDPVADRWVDAVMYELYYTKNQSRQSPTSDGRDNYFNNNLYRSGWTYEHRVIGVPFITLDEDRFRIANNTLIAHHFGITGLLFEKLPYKFLTSYRINYGAKGGSPKPQSEILSTYLELSVVHGFVDVNLELASDFSSVAAPNPGVGVRLSKRFFD